MYYLSTHYLVVCPCMGCTKVPTHSLASVSNVCKTVPRSLFWAPNGCLDLPEVLFEFPLFKTFVVNQLMAFFNQPIMVHTQILVYSQVGAVSQTYLTRGLVLYLGQAIYPLTFPWLTLQKSCFHLRHCPSLDVPQKLLLYPVADTYEELNLSKMPTLIWGQKKWPSKRGGQSVADPGEGPGGLGPPLFLDQKGPKIYFGNRVPPYLRVWIRHCYCREVSNKSQFMNFLFAGIMAIVERWPLAEVWL